MGEYGSVCEYRPFFLTIVGIVVFITTYKKFNELINKKFLSCTKGVLLCDFPFFLVCLAFFHGIDVDVQLHVI